MLLNLCCFYTAKMVVTLSDAITKCFGSRGTRDDEQVSGTVSAPLQDPPARADVSHGPVAGVVDVAFSGRVGVIDHGNICSLLTGCLQDVCFTMLRTLALVVLFLTLGCF
jgi:hypothetical protein